jgi:hypothetical protein
MSPGVERAARPRRRTRYGVPSPETALTLARFLVDERGRVSLGRLRPAPGPYLGVVEPDGTVVLRPAAVMTRSQARLLASPELMAQIDAFAADPGRGTRRGRPRRR